jgi:hypothetical protein
MAFDWDLDVIWADGRVESAEAGPFLAKAAWSPPSVTGRHDVLLTVEYRGLRPALACLRFRVALPEAPAAPWWLIPGLFYGENRPAECARLFPRFAVGADDADRMVSSAWEFRADRAATPAVFGWAGSGGVALVAPETTPPGMTGLGFAAGTHSDPARGSVHLTFPFREGPISYDGSQTPCPPETTAHTFQPGDRIELQLAVYALPADRHAYAAVLREEHDRRKAAATLRPWVSVEKAARLAAEGLWRWHYDAEPGVLLETAGFDRGIAGQEGRPVDRQAMHVGWVSGIPWAYALLRHARRVGHAEQAAAAAHVIDFICANLSPSGTFWGTWYRDRGWTQSWSPVRHSLHSRTLAEATLFLVRALELGEDLRLSKPDWVAAVRSNLDAVAARQRPDGNLGSSHHALTGEVLSWSGAAGLAWVSALAEAGHVEPARRAGEYYASFVMDEFINGAPEDVDLAPTSEDGYVAVMAYMSLYRATREPRWLELARRAADWMLTFRYSYNISFPAGTLLDVYGFATRGADNASPSNQHLHAYGLVCTAELAQLADACGDGFYAERARETLACFRQFVARFDGDFNAYRGMAAERYYHTACFQPKGMLLTLSHAWSVGALLLGCEQALEHSAALGA